MIMGMKTMLSVVLAHVCAATINDTVTMAKDIMDGFPISLLFNTTDEAGPTPQTNDTYLFYLYERHNNSLDNFVQFMPWFYILIFLISLPLNVLALVTFTCKIQEKKPSTIFMSHLACVDLLFTLLLPLKIHYHLNSLNWVFGEVTCRVLTTAYYCYMYCSILLMMCMSVDRLLGVVFPIASLTWRSRRKASCACVLVWLLALAVNVSFLSMNLTHKHSNDIVTCLDRHFLVSLYVFSICFFLPLVITLVSYIIIIYVLCVKSNNVASSSSSSSSDKQRKAIIMAIAVLTEFVVCFGPTNVIFIVYVATGNTGRANSLYSVYMLAVCLGSASVFLDPLLYYYGSSQFRQMIQSVLKR